MYHRCGRRYTVPAMSGTYDSILLCNSQLYTIFSIGATLQYLRRTSLIPIPKDGPKLFVLSRLTGVISIEKKNIVET